MTTTEEEATREASTPADMLTGIFSGPVVGLKFQTPTCSGVTGENGEFNYRQGERVAFLVGDLVLGAAHGSERVNCAQLVSRVDGNPHKLHDPMLTNMARFLQTLDQDGDLSTGITIAPVVHDIVGSRPIKFSAVMGATISDVGDPIEEFTHDPVIKEVLKDLNEGGAFSANMPRRLRSPEAARNEVRRNILGILRFRDVKIPLRNGSYVYADVFRPDKQGQFPVIMNLGVYGRAFVHHSICDDDDAEMHEKMEERYFSGNPDGYMYENHETVDTAVWVPQDYTVVRVDTPGTGINPGTLRVFGIAEAEAFYDAIEWGAEQPWSNGNIGLYGMSYYAITQHAVASLQPPHLKAMVAIGTDVNTYEELLYQGGILSEDFWPTWFNSQVRPAVCGELRADDFAAVVKAHPFNEPDGSRIYGSRADLYMSPDLSKITVPQWIVAATTHSGHVHQIGGVEAYLAIPTENKKLDFWEDWFVRSYSSSFVADHMAFFDHWLKGVENGIMQRPSVRVEVRAGNGSLYVAEENEWPIARTRYQKFYLDTAPSAWPGDGRRADFMQLNKTSPTAEEKATYSAEINFASIFPRKGWDSGVSFVSEPFQEDTVLAGHAKAVLWVSSTSDDMDIYVSIRVMDEFDREVDFAGPMFICKDPTAVNPLAKGWLKVSHRKLDERRTTDFRPKQTHLEADYAPLKDDEVVQVEVEITPIAALVKKGQRIRFDVQPYDGAGHGTQHAYDARYHDGALNTVHTGPGRESYIQLPVVPANR